MTGVFDLETAGDLYNKLKRNYAAYEKDPINSDLAFDLFVTAWHLLEWVYPNDSTKQKEVRDSNVVLQICEHLAVGAKHFEPKNPKLESVKRSSLSGGAWTEGVWAKGAWKKGAWGEKLSIALENEAAKQYGENILAIDLAKDVMAFWKGHEDKFT